MLDPSETLNPKIYGYTLLANNMEEFVVEGIALPWKRTVDLNYLRSEGRIALTFKQNYSKWHKNYAL